MAEKDQVEIRHPKNPNRKMMVDPKDFDPNRHEAWSEKDEAELQLREKMSDPKREVVPGPPMQMPAGVMQAEALHDQPNAAVIEAPGSRAAEIIQRGRGDVPIFMRGTRQDRAEQETRRAESAQGAPFVSPRQTEEDRELRRREYSSDQSIWQPDMKQAQARAEEQVDHEKAREKAQMESEKSQAKAAEPKKDAKA